MTYLDVLNQKYGVVLTPTMKADLGIPELYKKYRKIGTSQTI